MYSPSAEHRLRLWGWGTGLYTPNYPVSWVTAEQSIKSGAHGLLVHLMCNMILNYLPVYYLFLLFIVYCTFNLLFPPFSHYTVPQLMFSVPTYLYNTLCYPYFCIYYAQVLLCSPDSIFTPQLLNLVHLSFVLLFYIFSFFIQQ